MEKISQSRASTAPKPGLLFLLQYLQTGGIEWMVVHLAQAVAKDYRSEIFVYDHQGDAAKLDPQVEALGIPLHRVQKESGFSLAVLKQLRHKIKSDRIKILHTHHLGGLMYAVLLKLSGAAIKIVHTQHSFVHLAYSKKYLWYERFFTFFADAVCAVSEQVQTEYQTFGISRRHVHLIKNGTRFASPMPTSGEELLRLRQSLGRFSDIENESIWILYLGRVHSGKGQDHALDLWSGLRPELRRRCLLIIQGPTTDAEFGLRVDKKISQTVDRERIKRLPGTSNPEKWLQVSDVFLSCSESEGHPLAPLEAAGSGLICLLSDIPGHQSLKINAQFLSLSEPSKVGAKILSDIPHELEQRLALRATTYLQTAYLRDECSIEKMAETYASLYAKL